MKLFGKRLSILSSKWSSQEMKTEKGNGSKEKEVDRAVYPINLMGKLGWWNKSSHVQLKHRKTVHYSDGVNETIWKDGDSDHLFPTCRHISRQWWSCPEQRSEPWMHPWGKTKGNSFFLSNTFSIAISNVNIICVDDAPQSVFQAICLATHKKTKNDSLALLEKSH